MTVRVLQKGDETLLENFLKDYAETSMFIRSNLREVGLGFKEETYHGDYYGEINENGALQGVLAHYWNANLMVQSPDVSALQELVSYFREHAIRPVGGVMGPHDQARNVINGLSISDDAFALNCSEGLYKLDLNDMRIPEAYDSKRHRIVPARDAGKELLTAWLKAYNMEALGSDDDDILEERIKGDVKHTIEGDHRWALLVDDTPVALCGFNARLPDIVQIGPVWTPPAHRSNGYARIALALSLSNAKERGIKSSVLFTDNPPAIKAYESIGYNEVGSFRISLLKTPMPINQKMAI